MTDEERMWTDANIDKVAMKHFPNVDFQKALARPILYSNWLSKDYVPVDREDLRDYVKARLKVAMPLIISRDINIYFLFIYNKKTPGVWRITEQLSRPTLE